MAEWRLAKSLVQLRTQVNARWPTRDKSSDGSIGDPAHAATKSDHNPNSHNVVQAIDVTHDPGHGLDARKLAEALVAIRDPRIKYIISNAQIVSSLVSPWVWRPYSGVNAHRHHVHISVSDNPSVYDDDRPWDLSRYAGGAAPTPTPAPIPISTNPRLKRGDRGPDVQRLQRYFMLPDDGIFGSKTEQAVLDFQREHGLTVDGIVGPMTWAKIATVPAKT